MRSITLCFQESTCLLVQIPHMSFTLVLNTTVDILLNTVLWNVKLDILIMNTLLDTQHSCEHSSRRFTTLILILCLVCMWGGRFSQRLRCVPAWCSSSASCVASHSKQPASPPGAPNGMPLSQVCLSLSCLLSASPPLSSSC